MKNTEFPLPLNGLSLRKYMYIINVHHREVKTKFQSSVLKDVRWLQLFIQFVFSYISFSLQKYTMYNKTFNTKIAVG